MIEGHEVWPEAARIQPPALPHRHTPQACSLRVYAGVNNMISLYVQQLPHLGVF